MNRITRGIAAVPAARPARPKEIPAWVATVLSSLVRFGTALEGEAGHLDYGAYSGQVRIDHSGLGAANFCGSANRAAGELLSLRPGKGSDVTLLVTGGKATAVKAVITDAQLHKALVAGTKATGNSAKANAIAEIGQWFVTHPSLLPTKGFAA